MLNEQEWSAVWLSLQIAVIAVLLCIGPAIGISWLLARKTFWGKSVLDALVHLPLVLPPVAVGYLLLLAMGSRTAIGQFIESTLGIRVAFNWPAAAIASAVMGFPLMVRAIRLSMESVDSKLEQAAHTLGASPTRAFVTVTLPLALPGIISGMVLCFARSLGEFGATITFAGNIEGRTRTLPLAIFNYSQSPGGDAGAVRLLVVCVVLSFLALLASEWLTRRARLERSEG